MKYKMYGGMVLGTIDKRTYEEEVFIKNLDPAMDENERISAIAKYLYRPDLDLVKALLNPYDGASKCEAFGKALCKAIETDSEPWDKKVSLIANAMATNNAQALLSALCGFAATSLAKQAMIIPDDGEEFYSNRVPATMIVCWSNGEFSESKCYVDAVSNKIYGFSLDALKTYEDSATLQWVGVKVKPSFGKEKYLRKCISEEERVKSKDEISYWYSTDPDDYNRPAPYVVVDSPY